MNLDEIENRINSIIDEAYHRQIVFWYDENQEFIEDIENIHLNNAKLHILKDNLIQTKYRIEFEDRESNYLIYAPFAQPEDNENYLADLTHYAVPFTADKIEMIRQELGIPPEFNHLLKKYSLTRKDISGVVTSIGPGSYTGVRISLTIAKVIALCLDVPIYPVSSLRVLKDNDKPSICLINARSGRSYFGVYEKDKVIVSDTIKTNEEVLAYIKEHPSYSICGNVSYLGYENLDTNICLQMVSLLKSLSPFENSLALKPVYLKD